MALNPYLCQKAYYFKRILEKDEQVTDLKESIHRSLMDWDGKSYGKQFQDLSIGLNADTLEFFKTQQVLRTLRQLELVCIFGNPQSPNAKNNDKSLYRCAVEELCISKECICMNPWRNHIGTPYEKNLILPGWMCCL